jgi:hypothetical protein
MADDKQKQQEPQPQKPKDVVEQMRAMELKDLKALHFDLFAQKQQADHLYQMVIAVIQEKLNPEPTKVSVNKQ